MRRGEGAAYFQIKRRLNDLTNAADVDELLRAEEAAVHRHYRPARVRPWVLTTLGRPGEGLCSDLRRLARLRLRRPDASQAVSAASVLQRLLHRWRAELSCTIVMGDTSVYLAALHSEPVGHVFQELGPADLQVYDLQNYRQT